MKKLSKSRRRRIWLAAATAMTVSLWWNAVHSDDGQIEEARRIIVYSTTS
ncbi:hypothetical protein [Cohnella thailandensis]|uniref:Flavodoxin-like domain-containing protein n=1 Tax=Cohnella thailandensis TaxID=557557 RepID=A0A841SWM6_9BACL|nr:hypothetical protein [Cohnella thailandensis]MBB6634260.1 hypothetical protein [Cohnella thailandensis]MBP1972242.1 hypothetical protein [Cohnella thailandensis]